MIISFDHKFVFIKTLKTAGTSVEVSLNRFLGPDDIATPVFPDVEGHQPRNYMIDGIRVRNHGSSKEAREVIRARGSDPKDFHFWSIEREPLDKCLSHYSMLRFSPDHAKFSLARPRSILSQAPILNWNTYCLRGNFPLDDSRLLDPEGRLQVDSLLHYENLSSELAGLMASLGIQGFSLEATAKSGFRGKAKNRIRSWQVNRIYNAFSRTLPHSGYDSNAVSNTLRKLEQSQLD